MSLTQSVLRNCLMRRVSWVVAPTIILGLTLSLKSEFFGGLVFSAGLFQVLWVLLLDFCWAYLIFLISYFIYKSMGPYFFRYYSLHMPYLVRVIDYNTILFRWSIEYDLAYTTCLMDWHNFIFFIFHSLTSCIRWSNVYSDNYNDLYGAGYFDGHSPAIYSILSHQVAWVWRCVGRGSHGMYRQSAWLVKGTTDEVWKSWINSQF